MSEQLAISYADLSGIQRALSSLETGVATVGGQLTSVGQELTLAKSELDKLAAEFRTFVQADLKAKELQLAETRIVKVRQELETAFGHYATVRRHTTGILQAADISVVRLSTVSLATEQMMLAAPRYWLAPTLVALAAWLADNRTLAERALAECLRRDDRKASLFFALVCRRGARHGASRQWLTRYFAQQDSRALDRETILLLDAVTHGIFGAEMRAMCAAQMKTWLAELEAGAGFAARQTLRWSGVLLTMVPKIPPRDYIYLRKNSPTWPALEEALTGARLHGQIAAWTDGIFSGELQLPPQLAAAVDDILDGLVARFDDEELPLRRQERKLHLIIEENGDKAAAEKRFDVDKEALQETTDFAQLLTNAAFNPEIAHASRASQRMAIALSRDWIMAAHDELTAKNRAAVPVEIELKINDWKGKSRDGADEAKLVESLKEHSDYNLAKALRRFQLGVFDWVVVAGGIALMFQAWPLPAALGLLAFVWLAGRLITIRRRRKMLAAEYAVQCETDTKILRGALAELVDWRKAYAKADAEAEQVRASLAATNPAEHMQRTYDSGRGLATN